MSARGGTPYLGSKISLISKAQIRYEGILSSVDTERSTVSLAKVKSFGTEDRHAERPVPPKDEIYEFIIFRGSDIKDITVSEPPKQHHGIPRDPAIVQSSLAGSSAPFHPRWSPYRDMNPAFNQMAASSLLSQQYNAALGLVPGFHGIPARRVPMVEQAVQTVPQTAAAQKKGKSAAQAPPARRAAQRTARDASQVQKENVPSNRPSQQKASKVQEQITESQKQRQKQGNRRTRNRSRGQLLVKGTKPTTLQFESDFDFETANAQFKDDLTKKETTGQFPLPRWFGPSRVADLASPAAEKDSEDASEVPSTAEEETLGEKYYDKARSFFDNVSSELKPKRTTWAEEKKLNMETFGVPGRFIRGRGFRGRGRKSQGTVEQRPLPKIGSGRV
ncbi:protein LSM14 homolog B-B-like [Neosynchiropus ocellatus]